MAVNTNATSIAFVEEKDLGVEYDPAIGFYMEPNSISEYGATITTVARNPISNSRQNKKGTITDLSSTVSFEQDLTISSFVDMAEGMFYSTFRKDKAQYWNTGELKATATGYTVTGLDTGPLPAGTLIFVSGFLNGVNNGLKVVEEVTAAHVPGEILVAGLTVETSTNASIYVVGFQCEESDLTIDASGNLNSVLLDFTTLNLYPGCGLWVGGLLASNSFVSKDNGGLVRVREVKKNTIAIDKYQTKKFTLEDGVDKTIQIFVGWFIYDVPVNSPLFKQRSYAFEVAYPDLEGGATGYEYSMGNVISQTDISLPLSDKSTMSISTFGTDTVPITMTKRPWKLTNPKFTEAFSTTSDILRMRINNLDETGLTTMFKDVTISINQNAGGENILGKLGPEFVNYGNMDISLNTTAVFTSAEVSAKIRNNCTVSADFCLFNNDGALYFDIPAMTLGDGSKDFTVNEKIKVSLSSNAFGDEVLGHTLGVTYFPYLPSDKASVC